MGWPRMGWMKVYVALRFTVEWFIAIHCAYFHTKGNEKALCPIFEL